MLAVSIILPVFWDTHDTADVVRARKCQDRERAGEPERSVRDVSLARAEGRGVIRIA
jgi:hypothetical protein